MGSKKKNQSIVVQTAFRVSAVFVTAIILMTICFVMYLTTAMTDNVLKEKRNQLQIIAETIESKMESITNPILSLGSYNSVLRLLKGHYPKYSAEWMQDIRNIDDYLNNINLFYDYVRDIVIISPDNETVYSMNNLVKADYNFTEQKWFQSALKQEYVIPSLTVAEIKNRCIPCIYWGTAIFVVVMKYSNLTCCAR